jgi:DNA replication and repair protein RecF
MSLDGKPVRTFASRGEVRSAMFALHLARFDVLTGKRGIEPVVLIDDVMSELDSKRRARVLELLPKGQVFLTACDPPPEVVKFASDFAHFEMTAGEVKRID